jgi:signal transduction histidine kinase/DNA-binding response OmpR family regulator
MTVPAEPKSDILVVDDLPENLLVYQCVLEELGQNLVFARSGHEALSLLLERDFAVILMDVNMPGMDGFETATLIRQRRKSARTPIIFLTAFSDDLPAARGYATGAVDFISAPVVPDVLRAKVRVFVELHQLRQQTALQAEERVRRALAEDTARRAAFLAEAGSAFVSSLDFETTLSALTRVSIPFLADLSIVCLLDGQVVPGRTDLPAARRWPERDKHPWARVEWAWLEERASRPALASGSAPAALLEVLGRALWTGAASRLGAPITIRPPTTVHAPPSDATSGNGTATRAIELADGLAVPLAVRGRTLGVLCLGRRAPRPAYTSDELALCDELALRASMALENTLLVHSIQEAARRKDEYLAMLAHELRNPLAPIRNAVQWMRLVGPTDPGLGQARDLIDRQVTHLVRLVDDLLDATRIARGKVDLRLERCDMAAIVRQVADDHRPLLAGGGLSMSVDVPADPIWLQGDPTRLTQVVSNLLHNAIKFTDHGGAVSLSLTSEDEEVVLRVHDTGIGIEPHLLSSIFDVFVQADRSLDRVRGGLGLGLSLVKGLVTLHGGSVHASSAGLGRGSEFVVRLPLREGALAGAQSERPTGRALCLSRDQAPSAQTPAAQRLAAQGVTRRVLIVEDNLDAAHTAARLLELAGHQVRTAHDGAGGLEVAREFRPEVILCDIGLPGGMSGYDVARAVRQDTELSPAYLVAVTGYGRDEDHRQAEQAGFDLHLTKPFDCQRLYDILAHVAS